VHVGPASWLAGLCITINSTGRWPLWELGLFQIFSSGFSFLFCRSGWPQVIWVAGLLFSVLTTDCIHQPRCAYVNHGMLAET